MLIVLPKAAKRFVLRRYHGHREQAVAIQKGYGTCNLCRFISFGSISRKKDHSVVAVGIRTNFPKSLPPLCGAA